MSAYFALANVGLPGVSLHFKIQHQNEINDAFFLADALTKRWAHVLVQPCCGLVGCMVAHAACLLVA